MANDEHLGLLQQGVEAWNAWKTKNPYVAADLSDARLEFAKLNDANLSRADLFEADLFGADLSGADLKRAVLMLADLSGANLREADLFGVDLSDANLQEANISEGNLSYADLREADLCNTNLSRTDLSGANLTDADLREVDLSGAQLYKTVFVNVDLTDTKGLDTCDHRGPSIVDHRTLQRSRNLPLSFLRGCGLPERLIDYLPSILGEAIQFYSCFISYSSKDQEFADRLHADLQNKGVRCWFAPHDLPIGAKTWDTIDEAIRLRDKVLLILSKRSIESDWVEDEVNKALAEERRRKELVLFPVRIDNTVMKTDEPWASRLRDSRNIGDFRSWKNHDAYQKAFERVLRDLQTTPGVPLA